VRKPDRYCSYQDLAAVEKEGVDYLIDLKDRSSNAAIIAPHGRYIEPWTSQLAAQIAGDDLSSYSFDGTRPRPHHELHITSHHFDEPRCVGLVENSRVVIAIHGRRDGEDPRSIYLGGGNRVLVKSMATALEKKFEVMTYVPGFEAKCRQNICNLGPGGGVQIELPMSLRKSRLKREMFAAAVRGIVDRTLAARHVAEA
jgi:phage replication-related protein YjqB (UPF0714/DUF867 family)